MSFNSIYKQKNNLNKKLFESFLELNDKRNFAFINSKKDKALFESDVIQFKERIKGLRASLNDKNIFSEATKDSFFEDENYIKMLHTEIITTEDYYLEKVKLYQNVLAFEKQKIDSKVRELKAKLNILKSSTELFSFVFKESFLNFYNLNNLNNTKQTLNVDIETELATLPEEKREEVKIKGIFIGSLSNGKPGNAEGKHKNVFNVTKDNKAKFEYFKFGETNLKLELSFKLGKLDVINEIVLKKSEISASSSLEVTDILFETESGKEISIQQLCDSSIQSFEIDSLVRSELVIKFLPVECKSFKLVVESKDYSIVGGRKKHQIGFTYIGVNKVSYLQEGEIASNVINFPNEMNFVEAKIHSWPRNISNSTNLTLYENNYTKSRNIKTLSKEVLDSAKNISYRLNVSKKDTNLEEVNVYKENSNFFNGKYTSKIFNKDLNPNTVKIEPNAKNIKVIQYDLCRRSSDEDKKISLGYINGSGLNKLSLPLSLNKADSEVRIFINNKEVLNQVESIDLVTDETKFYVEDSKNIYVYSNDTFLKEVSFLLKVKSLLSSKRNGGYYITIDEKFDFSKNQIKIYSHLENLSKEIELERNVSKFSIEENIVSYELIVYENSSWRTAETSEFNFNLKTGILNINQNILNLEKRINIKYNEKNLVNDFEIWKDSDEILGVFVKDENVNIVDNQEIFSNTNITNLNLNKENIIENSVVFEKGFFSTSDLEEVPYINGQKEFKNIKKIEKDLIPAFTVSNQTVTFFTLNNVHREDGFDDRIKVYNELGAEVTGVTITSTGNSVTVSGIQVSQIENWYLSYYTIIEEEVGFRFSINYKDGVIYFSDSIDVTNKYVYYQSGLLEVEYDLCKDISNFNYSEKTGLLEIYLEETSNFNNKIKIIWENTDALFNLSELKKYYSPLIYEISFGVN